jgi:hypothetical protein
MRSFAPLSAIERAASALRAPLPHRDHRTGGAAIDVDNESDLEVVEEEMLERWKALQVRLARAA